jgi:hypothetical protein
LRAGFADLVNERLTGAAKIVSAFQDPGLRLPLEAGVRLPLDVLFVFCSNFSLAALASIRWFASLV